MSYGIGAALAKAYTYLEDPNESVAREQQTLAQMRTLKLQDDEIKKKADLDAAAYQQEISKFADTLLGPDKERINERSKQLGRAIKEKIRLSGGAANFLSAGGHTVLNEYKDSIINSTESNTYLENKKNSELIIKAQMEGRGNLINSRDLKSLIDYKQNNGGKISFTGLLNEVEVNREEYEYGAQIPPADILKNNYMAIVGNYALENPDASLPPSETELLSYTALKYGGIGSNYDLSFKMRDAQRKELEFAYGLNNKGKTGGVRGTGGGRGESGEDETYNSPDEKILVTTQAAQVLSHMGNSVNTVNDIPKDPINDIPEAHQLGGVNGQRWNKKFKHFNPIERGVFWDINLPANDIMNFGNSFTPKGAVRVLSGMEEPIAGAVLFGQPNENGHYDNIKNGTITGWTPRGDNVYMSNGTSLQGMGDIKSSGNYQIEGIVNAYKVSNRDNKTSIVMDAYDGDKLIEDGEMPYDENDTPRPGMFLALRSTKTDDVYYVDTMIEDPVTNNKIHIALGEYNDLTDIVNAGDRIRQDTKAADEALDAALQPLIALKARNESGPIYAAMNNEYKNNYMSSNGYSRERAQLIESFYLITAGVIAEQSGKSPEFELNNLVRNGYFTNDIVNDIAAKTGVDVGQYIRRDDLSNKEIIERIMSIDPDASQPLSAYIYDYILKNFERLNKG